MNVVFLDRDGVMNPLVYYAEHGLVDSPFTASQFRLFPGVAEAINQLHESGYKVVLTSNQPGMAKGNFSASTFEEVKQKMREELAKKSAILDGEYYCMHHPDGFVGGLSVDCDCRKPKSGMLITAAKDLGIADLSQSWMVGDGLTDVTAGKGAGCRTILLGRMKCELCRMMDEANARPDAIASNLTEAVRIILDHGGHKHGNLS